MFLNSFNYFRGIAIVVIVAGHCFDLADWKNANVVELTIRNLMAGGSCLFVFISGFLFHHVFYERFAYARFMKGKVKNVLLPYLVLSVVPIAYSIATRKPYFDGYYLPEGDGPFEQYLVPTLKYLWTGGFFIPTWYIPFIMLMFLLSPLHVGFIRLKAPLRISILGTLLAVSTFVHRPIDNLSQLQSLVYFTPVYLLGIECSLQRSLIYRVLQGRELWVLLGALAIVLWQTLAVGHVGNYNKQAFVWAGPDWVLLQKVLVCVFMMVFLHRFEDRNWRGLGLLASASFGIYFLHAWVLALLYGVKGGRELGLSSLVLWPVATSLVLASSVGVAWLARRIFGKYSRMLTGW